ncbi:hypothetical protein JYU34_007905 [Plutella xylostella]|uniref:protein-tyrosine-phosphatase n=1 Tax=Plutella xylostella TaxID=51655 RepID=A0ABQ7QNC4_PLUXY|nr:hypothetical protein JYU34_007905 [Plutella xylostella]
MWGESSKECESNCQCSGLITDSFCLDSGNSATKRRREEATAQNFKLKMNPHSLDFNSLHKSPVHTHTPKRRVLGEIQNRQSPLTYLKSPLIDRSLQDSPLSSLLNSPKLNTPFVKRSTKKISRIFEERTRFKMSNKENEENMFSGSFTNKLDVCEDTRDAYPDSQQLCGAGAGVLPGSLRRSHTGDHWTLAKMSSASPEPRRKPNKRPLFGHGDELADELPDELADDCGTLHDLDAEFDCETFDQCTKYEIVSTDSPDIISRGRTTSSRKISAKNFVFGAPIAETEQSTSFNKPAPAATRMLTFEDDSFEFTSPENLRPKTSQAAVSVKKSLKFLGDTPTKNILRHENSNSSIGSMSAASPLSSVSSKLRLFPSSSTTSMESGFMSEIEEPFLDLDEVSNSPKLADFGQLLSGKIKDTCAEPEFSLKRPSLQRSLSYNLEASKARVSLFSRGELEERRSNKRPEPLQEGSLSSSKRRRGNGEGSLLMRSSKRPVLQRAYSENAASIMSALARSSTTPDLIGDFSLPHVLPAAASRHADLRAVSADVLADVLRGKYSGEIADVQVIDCRYPYEFEGGHIAGARNLYTPQQILSLMDQPVDQPVDQSVDHVDQAGKRRVLVFHCEYSLERGPKLCRLLRSTDRARHRDAYPQLTYPELYLLHDGYSAFYRQHPALCTPPGYRMMLDPQFKHELSTYRRNTEGSRKNSLM